MPCFGRKTEAQVIYDTISHNHDGRFGFTVYRCVYGNDEEWSRFMERLTAHAHADLDRDPYGHLVKPLIVWNVQDNETELDGQSGTPTFDPFSIFRDWVRSVKDDQSLSRYAHCIHADAEVVQSVLTGGEPGSRTPDDILRPKGFVNVIDLQFKEQPEQLGPEDISDDEERQEHNDGDEGYPPIEGCKREDVGWMKVAARMLVPGAYQLLMKNGWPVVYVRPPQVLIG
ncbi:hypothetical protein LTR65_003928 [Meristemomyces frigidus]